MAISDLEFRQVKKYMKDSCFTFTDEWLLACMTWVKENNRSVNFDIWKRELSEQWKDANLEEMESSCLPPNLSAQRVVKLPGKYGLQINSIRDIGESSYSQWSKLKKLENENTSVAATDSNEYTPTWQPTPKRCLHLTMTDGSQGVFGLEMQPIAGLSLTMKPGVKIVVLGPVDCRRGVLHLKPNNIRVVGGEVEDLFAANRMEKILADTLKVPASSLTQTQQLTTQSVTQSGSASAAVSNRRLEEISGDFPDSEDPFPDIGADDDIFMDIDEEALLRSSSNSSTVLVPKSETLTRSISQMTTQRINSASMRTTFTEEIEDFEDDFSTNVNQTSTSTRSMHTGLPSSSTSNKSAAPMRKSKPVFVPPIVQSKPKPAAITHNEGSSSSSSVAKSSSNTKIKVEKSKVATSTEFKSAKSIQRAITQSSSAGNAKQKNILEYMKPMPVIIDPPTPERQAKRRKRVEEQSALASTLKPELKVTATTQDENMMTDENVDVPRASTPQTDVNMDEDHEYSDSHSPPDDSLMRIVDETLESKLLESDTSEPSASGSTAKVSCRSYPVKVTESPYIYLAQVQAQLDELIKKRKVVHVKACVSTVVSNIQVDKGCWTLCVCINDGTGYLNCNISTSILTGIIGFTPTEMKKIKAEKTKEGKQRIAEGMNNLAKSLVHLNTVFAIELGEQPMITEIIELKLHHSAALKSRLFKLGL